jgi:hypothetical protein
MVASRSTMSRAELSCLIVSAGALMIADQGVTEKITTLRVLSARIGLKDS